MFSISQRDNTPIRCSLIHPEADADLDLLVMEVTDSVDDTDT
jgi:hypothetical protein